MLYMLRLTICLVMISLVFPGYSRPEDTPSVPEIGKDIPGVDMERLHLDVEKILKEVQKRKASGEVISAPPISQEQKDEGKEQTEKAMDAFNSTWNQQKLQDEKTRIQERDAPPIDILPAQPDSGKETVYVFLSSSMPDEAIHAYITQSALFGGGRVIPVFYGMKGGIENKRAAGVYFAHVMKENLDCTDVPGQLCPRLKMRMKINPSLFTQYSISQVPTVVYTNGDDSWSMGGDSTLDYLLEEINSEAQSPFLEQIIKKSRGQH
jgi:conjugal transfer pilus assembly protein TrbC